MDSHVIFLLILIIFLGFFAGAEIAIISLSEAKVRALINKGSSTAIIIQKLKRHPQQFFIVIQLGYNFVSTLLSVTATVWATEKFGNESLGIITGILTFVSLIFAEILPKAFAEMFATQCALFVARPLWLMRYLFYPIVWVLEKFISLLLSFNKQKIEKMTNDEIKAMIYLGAEGGALEEEEVQLIDNVLDFSDTRVSSAMIPRVKIFALSADTTVEDAVNRFLEEGFSRVPIYNHTIDNIIGILTIQDLLRANKNREKLTKLKNIDLIPPIFIPESKLLDDLFKEFQWKHQHMAIIIDEHASVTGLITMEDLLEEIVGDIVDESDRDEVLIEKLSDKSWRVDAEVTIEELNEALETEFDCDEHKTIRYLLLEKFQKIPRRGEDIKINNFHFFIAKIENNIIKTIRIVEI